MLGFEVSERTVSRLMPRRAPKREAVQRWMTFLRNHRDAIAAMDFFVVRARVHAVLDRARRLHARFCADPAVV
jgi:hypothetical protein